MEKAKKPLCQYGAKCYRKNKSHMSQYSHPSDTTDTENINASSMNDAEEIKQGKEKSTTSHRSVRSNNKTTKGNSGQSSVNGNMKKGPKRKKQTQAAGDKGPKKLKGSTTEVKVQDHEENKLSNSDDDSSDDEVKSNSWTYIKVTPKSVETESGNTAEASTKEDIIKQYYLVDMPPDFYSFFKFCESINGSDPLNVLKPFDLKLVGPYDLLSGKEVNVSNKELVLCHWRYFYDPPEFQTVLSSESGFHIGYWRDDPKEPPVFTASNNPTEDCTFKTEGENLFSAVHQYLTQRMKSCDPFTKTKIGKILTSLTSWAGENNFSLDKNTENMKKRQKKVNSRTFHSAGIVVPFDKRTEVGYRPLNETNANLKKMCSSIIEAKTEDQRKILMEKLQPLINFANIANDECDFGNSLELGIDLFCMGSPVFHNTIEHLLTTAYSLLDRPAFGDIIRVHLQNRRKDTNLAMF